MNYSKYILFLSLFIFLFSCEDDKAPSGIDLKVFYSKCVDSVSTPDYKAFDGKIYYVPVKDYPLLSINSWDSIKSRYKSSDCENGKTSSFLSPGTYFIEPDSFLSALSPTILEIQSDVLLEAEYYMIDCR